MSKSSAETMTKSKRGQTREETCARHAGMTRKIIKLKLKSDSHRKNDYLARLFLEAKWQVNHMIHMRKLGSSWSKIKDKDTLVLVKRPLGLEPEPLICLSSQMKQGLKERLKRNEQTIWDNIEKGLISHGELGFVSSMNSIPLKQYGNTYKFNDKMTRLKLQGFNSLFKICGGKQFSELPEGYEIANAVLLSKSSGYYINVTVYIPRVERERPEFIDSAIAEMDVAGLDAGISNNMTADDGSEYSWEFPETERLKEAQRKNQEYRDWTKKHYGYAQNSKKQIKIINREYEKMDNRKADAIRKFKHEVLENCGVVAIQDEQVSSWSADPAFSGVVHHSIIGGIIEELKNSPRTLVIDKWTRTTGVCPECGWVLEEKLSLSEREWTCPCCHEKHDRDQASARVIRLLAILGMTGTLPPEYGELLVNRLTILLGCGASTLIRQL